MGGVQGLFYQTDRIPRRVWRCTHARTHAHTHVCLFVRARRYEQGAQIERRRRELRQRHAQCDPATGQRLFQPVVGRSPRGPLAEHIAAIRQQVAAAASSPSLSTPATHTARDECNQEEEEEEEGELLGEDGLPTQQQQHADNGDSGGGGGDGDDGSCSSEEGPSRSSVMEQGMDTCLDEEADDDEDEEPTTSTMTPTPTTKRRAGTATAGVHDVLYAVRHEYDDLHRALKAAEDDALRRRRDGACNVNAASRHMLDKLQRTMLRDAFRTLANSNSRQGVAREEQEQKEQQRRHDNSHDGDGGGGGSGSGSKAFISLIEPAEAFHEQCAALQPFSLKQMVMTTMKLLRSDYNKVGLGSG